MAYPPLAETSSEEIPALFSTASQENTPFTFLQESGQNLWTLLICTLMVMPPNTRAGLGIGVVLLVLFALHKLTGPHEIRKPFWP